MRSSAAERSSCLRMKTNQPFSRMSFVIVFGLPALALFPIVSAADPTLSQLLEQANGGAATAQFDVARRYAAGQGVAKDDAQALTWFKKAAAQGHTKAEVSLGSIYAHGFGVPADFVESIRWYRLAAAKGDTTAQYNLGLDYAHAHGVELNQHQAARWFRKAADQGHARAQFNLGELTESGQGVPQSDLDAFILYSLASEHENQEHIFGKAKADEVIANRARTELRLSPAQRAAASRQIAARKTLAAVHPRKFGAPGMIGRSRGWWVWKKWNPETWEAEVTPDPPGEVIRVRVLPWATTYRHLAYGARFDQLLPGEKVNLFFDPDENHRRGYLVHFQDEISQMKGHGHFWQIVTVTNPQSFVAQVYAGDKPLDEKTPQFEIDAACQKWFEGKLVRDFPLQAGQQVYLTWVYRDNHRFVLLLTDAASLATLKDLEIKRIHEEIAGEGLAGQIESIDKDQVQFMVYSSYWAQSGQLQPNQSVMIAATGHGYHPNKVRFGGKVISQQNRGVYGSGVNDVLLQLARPEDAARLGELEGQVLRLIPGK